MKKFENITALHLDNSDYINGHLLPPAAREADTADIVIRGHAIVKNRLDNTSASVTKTTPRRDDYKGICLEADSFAINIYYLLHAAQVLQSSNDHDTKISGNEIINFACEYSKAAAENRII